MRRVLGASGEFGYLPFYLPDWYQSDELDVEYVVERVTNVLLKDGIPDIQLVIKERLYHYLQEKLFKTDKTAVSYLFTDRDLEDYGYTEFYLFAVVESVEGLNNAEGRYF